MSKCNDYETFTGNITKKAVRVGMDIAVMKIQSVGQRTITVVFWLDLSFIDNRLRICNCQANEDNMRKNHFMLIGAHKENADRGFDIKDPETGEFLGGKRAAIQYYCSIKYRNKAQGGGELGERVQVVVHKLCVM